MSDKAYYIYILSNTHLNVIYTGVTSDLIRRVYEHKEKLCKGFTQKYNVDRLVYFELFQDVRDAITREKQIKSWSRARKNKLISELNPTWKDLYEEIIG